MAGQRHRCSAPGAEWTAGPGEYEDIRYEKGEDEAAGIAKITIARPHVRNAFRPQTVIEIVERVRACPRGSRCSGWWS